MKDKFNLGIEVSESVSKTSVPDKIKRYDVVQKKQIKIPESSKNELYRYRPGVNSFMTGDLDV